MKKLIAPLLVLFALIACKSKSSTEKDSTKDSANNNTVVKDTSAPATGALTKKLVFERYEEGDYPHLVFTDPETKEGYDFGHPPENKLEGVDLVIADTTTSFGFRQNAKAVGTSYMVTMEKKMVDGYDGNGQPMRVEGWRITRITK